jgi:hypothetical protein
MNKSNFKYTPKPKYNISYKMRRGNVVKLKNPTNADEEKARFYVIDEMVIMGKIKIQLICDLIFKPIELVGESEVEPV